MSTLASEPAQFQIGADQIASVSETAPWKRRRVRKEFERLRSVAEEKVPADCRLASNVIVWRNWVFELPEFALLRADCRRKMAEFVERLIRIPNVDPGSMTVMPVWSRMEELLGLHRATIARYFARLASWGALCTVARGRSAAKTPTATGREKNEAGIYAFIQLIESEAVDISATPDPSPDRSEPMRGRAREDTRKEQASPAPFSGRVAPRRRVQAMIACRTEPFFGRHATTNAFDKRGRKAARLQAAAELQFLVLPLRRETTAWVAHVCKPFFELGWTIADIQHALDWRPDGTTWPHSGADTVRSIRAFIHVRLGAWVTESGQVMRSHNQRLQAEASRMKAVRAAEAQARAQQQAAATPPPAGGWRSLFRRVNGRDW